MAVAILPFARSAGRRPRIPGRNRRTIGRRADQGASLDRRFLSSGRTASSARSFAGLGPPRVPHGQADLSLIEVRQRSATRSGAEHGFARSCGGACAKALKMGHYRALFDETPDPENCAAMVEVQEAMAMKETEAHQRQFEWFEQHASKPAWIFPLRKAGMARFAELGFPTLQDEDWRFTNLAALVKLPFRPALDPSNNVPTSEVV